MSVLNKVRKDSLDLAAEAGAKALAGFEAAVAGLQVANEHLEDVIEHATARVEHHQGRHAAALDAQKKNATIIARIKSLTS